jgi:hypothetical protein
MTLTNERERLVKCMADALYSKNYDNYIQFEFLYYIQHVKVLENKAHYEECLSDVENLSECYGDRLRSETKEYLGPADKVICYFLPSIDTDLAHVEILSGMLEQHDPSSFKIFVAGFSSQKVGCSSKLLTNLALDNKICLVPLSQTHKSLVEFIVWFNKSKAAQLVIMSAPILIPAFTVALGESKVTWFSSKFELDCFKSLKHRFSCCASEYQRVDTGKSTWHRSPPALIEDTLPIFDASIRESGVIKLLTINREEKIRQIPFLKAVQMILTCNPAVEFYWASRAHDPSIQAFFDGAGLGGRCHFLGWVDPVRTINNFDIFLDTPSLSGTVAAAAFAAGIPLITFRSSQSWIEFFEKKLAGIATDSLPGKQRFPLIASDFEDYVKLANKLISNFCFRKTVSSLQRSTGVVFFDRKQLYRSHAMSLQQVTGMNFMQSV